MLNIRENLEVISKIKNELKTRRTGNLLNLSLSGSHTYGFPSADSDFDLRGIFVTDTVCFFKLRPVTETFEEVYGDYDVVLYELRKAINLILKGNGNLLENLAVEQITTSPEYVELKKLAEDSYSQRTYEHYKGMAMHNYKKFILSDKEEYRDKSIKKYLYVMRALMSGIYFLESGEIEPNITALNSRLGVPHVDELIELKVSSEKGTVPKDMRPLIEKEIDGLYVRIDEALAKTDLPPEPTNEDAFEKFLLKTRRKYFKNEM